MSGTANRDPLEGFDIIDYDPETERVTIQLDRLVLKHSEQAVAEKCVEIIKHGPSVAGVHVKARE